jgi:hypothetical protein
MTTDSKTPQTPVDRRLALESSPLPWGYGADRITALVRSPDDLYLYWEITDHGIADARARLGPAGADGWFNLRLYDTTGREFDGTNANHYVDLHVDRAEREHFLAVHRPGSSLHVEIGVKTLEGYFQPIARSGRADFPRKSPSPNTSLEWMTVAGGEESPAAAPYRSRFAGSTSHAQEPAATPPSAGSPAHDPPPATQTPVATASQTWTVSTSMTSEWVTLSQHDLHQLVELPSFFASWRTQWSSDLRFLRWAGQWPGAPMAGEGLTWHTGPFPFALGPFELPDSARVEVTEGGVPMLVPTEWGPVQIVGPWRVTIRGLEKRPSQRVLATWTMHWVRVAPVRTERWITSVERVTVAAHDHFERALGASEASLVRGIGASEAWRLGASERMWLGASEWMLMGASELALLGASELALFGLGLGASALLMRGASEWMLVGGSEQLLGASEWLALGGSPVLFLGSSEQGEGRGA